MDLLSPWILVVAAFVALAGLCLGAWWIPRLGRPGKETSRPRLRSVITFVERLLAMVLSSALVTLGAAMALNYSNDWYASWSDLLGTGSDASTHTHHSGSIPSAVGTTPPPSRASRSYPALPSPGERLQTFTVASADGQTRNTVLVLLPEHYFDAGAQHRLYPVILAAHGMPGHPQVWLKSMNVGRALDTLAERHRISDSIVVMPSIMTSGGRDTECVFGPHGPREIENWLSRTVPDFVMSHVRANPSRDAWATLGFSAGGWCAAMLTMLHPDRFSAAMVLGGYFTPWWDAQPPWPQASAEERRLDLVKLAATKPPAVALWVMSSDQDPSSGPATTRFVHAARSPLAVTSVMLAAGGHRTSLWNDELPAALSWLAASLPAFRP